MAILKSRRQDAGPELEAFRRLAAGTTRSLNERAGRDGNFFLDKGGTRLEGVVRDEILRQSLGTCFEGAVELVSGASFPDIVVGGRFGVEVKSSQASNWKSPGNSVLESNRVGGVSEVLVIFGKLAPPVEFMCRPYEECLADIRVTHHPRFFIDMRLPAGRTIFDKMLVAYDDFRKNQYPIDMVKEYFRGQIKENEYMWWLDKDQSLPVTIKFLNDLPKAERVEICLEGLILFPDLFGGKPAKFNEFLIHLLQNRGLVSHNLRDLFTAGGKFSYAGRKKKFVLDRVPKIFKLLVDHKDLFLESFRRLREDGLTGFSEVGEWIDAVADLGGEQFKDAGKLLADLLT